MQYSAEQLSTLPLLSDPLKSCHRLLHLGHQQLKLVLPKESIVQMKLSVIVLERSD